MYVNSVHRFENYALGNGSPKCRANPSDATSPLESWQETLAKRIKIGACYGLPPILGVLIGKTVLDQGVIASASACVTIAAMSAMAGHLLKARKFVSFFKAFIPETPDSATRDEVMSKANSKKRVPVNDVLQQVVSVSDEVDEDEEWREVSNFIKKKIRKIDLALSCGVITIAYMTREVATLDGVLPAMGAAVLGMIPGMISGMGSNYLRPSVPLSVDVPVSVVDALMELPKARIATTAVVAGTVMVGYAVTAGLAVRSEILESGMVAGAAAGIFSMIAARL